jgi:hypothetical protein
MFAGTAFVDMDYLRKAGYTNRKAARKAFFQKARVGFYFFYVSSGDVTMGFRRRYLILRTTR